VTAAFTITKLANSQALIEGTDSAGVEGCTLVSTVQWDEIAGFAAHQQATDEFGEVVKEFYAPLTDAADRIKAQLEVPKGDNISHYVLKPGKDGTKAEAEVSWDLNTDSTLLLIVQRGRYDMLRWVRTEGVTTLVVTAPNADLAELPGQPADEVAETDEAEVLTD